MLVERITEQDRGVGAAEAGKCMAAPADQVRGVQSEIRSVGELTGNVRQEVIGGVEGAQAGLGLIVSGERFAVGGGEPGAQEWRPLGGEQAGVAAELDRVGAVTDVAEHNGLFGQGVGVQRG